MRLCTKGPSPCSLDPDPQRPRTSVSGFLKTFNSDHVTMSREATLFVGAVFMCLLYACAVAQITTTVAPSQLFLGQCRANADCQGPPPPPGQIRLCCPAGRRVTLRVLSEAPLRRLCLCAPTSVSGTCWQGDQCASCNQRFVGSINGLSVCCPNCLQRGLILSSSSCDCNNN